MSKRRPIAAKEIESIRDSVDRAWLNWLSSGKARINQPRRGHSHDEWLEYIKRSNQFHWGATLAEEAAENRTARLFLRVLTGRAELGGLEILNCCKVALGSRDFEFFRALIYVMDSPVFTHPDRLRNFLLSHWDMPTVETAGGRKIELFYFSQDGLSVICQSMLGIQLAPDSVAKVRNRLKLPAFKRDKWNAQVVAGKLRAVRRN
jgi:hypothetical protein